MHARVQPLVAGPVPAARSFWQVSGYDTQGVLVSCRVFSTLTRAYKEKQRLIDARCAVVVVEHL